jgi:23S rRNA pseudouridine2605 synthase
MTTDRIEVDGAQVVAQTKSYWMLNKPRGVVTTASDEKGRRTVYEFLNDDQRWLAPVGRLDKASEGLLLFTNDSEWASELLAPESHVEKTYHVQVNIVADRAFVDVLLDGVAVNGGEVLRAKKASILRSGEKNTWLEIILDEGKNRQIRRMLAALEAEVIRLVRIGIGQVALGRLGKGQLRQLTAEEKAALDACLTSAKSKANRNAG